MTQCYSTRYRVWGASIAAPPPFHCGRGTLGCMYIYTQVSAAAVLHKGLWVKSSPQSIVPTAPSPRTQQPHASKERFPTTVRPS